MTNKKNEPGKDAPRPGGDGGPKKPVPTIDLKAVEVKSSAASAQGSPGSQAASKPAAGATSSTSSSTSSAATGSGSATSVPPSGASGSGASGSGRSGPGGSGSTAQAAASGKDSPKPETGRPGGSSAQASVSGSGSSQGSGGKGPPPRPPAKKSSGSGIGGFLSHLTAGIVGGFLALLGADTIGPQIAPQLGLPSQRAADDQATSALTERLAKLEKSIAETSEGGAANASGELAAKVEAAQARLSELDGLNEKVTALAQVQESLSEKTTALSENAGAASGEAVPEERFASLERQLATIVAAAGQNPDAQGIPQLAGLTGRVADLEQTLQNQIAALRAGVNEDLETRIKAIAETSEQAKSGTSRIDRQLATISTDSARLGQRMEALKADTDRLSENLRAVQEETGTIRSTLDGFKGDVESKVAKLAKPEDISQAIAQVSSKISTLEENVAGVVKAEEDRRANAQRIVLSLELANLKRALDRGEGFAGELAEVEKASTGVLDLAPLKAYADEGVATQSELISGFTPVSHAIMDADAVPKDGSVFDQLLAGAKSVVRVRKVNHDPNDASAEAVVGRIEKALQEGQYGQVLEEAKSLSTAGMAAAKPWLAKVEARHSVDKALGEIEGQLKSSLSGTEAATGEQAK